MGAATAPSSSMAMAPEYLMTTKGWSVERLVALGMRMQPVPRESAFQNHVELERKIKEKEAEGVPLVIEGFHKAPSWPKEIFNFEWLLEHTDETLAVRDCITRRDKEVSFKEFLQKSREIPQYTYVGEKERLYGKDAICPNEWHDWLLSSGLPDVSKPGSSEDVLEFLPETERVETLMCYYGIGDTFTAAHKDLCASSGQNLMCSAERDGSAFWFMTSSSDAGDAAAYFQTLGSELDHEAHVATVDEFARAPFTVYVTEQRIGDLVLVPRRSCHQVVNHGGLTAKMSWSRMTVEGLSIAFHHELPLYRRVCRAETYRVRLLVYRALLKYTDDLRKARQDIILNIPENTNAAYTRRKAAPWKSKSRALSPYSSSESLQSSLSPEPEYTGDNRITLSTEHAQLVSYVSCLLIVFDKILREEDQGDTVCKSHVARNPPGESSSESMITICEGASPLDVTAERWNDGLVCDFCGADIFQSFFECCKCKAHDGDEDSILVCPSCYVEGRACECTIMMPVQQYSMDMLLDTRNAAQKLLDYNGYSLTGQNDGIKFVALSRKYIAKLVPHHPGIFTAGCQLLMVRKQNVRAKPDLSCRHIYSKDRKPHMVPRAGAVSCKKCHSALCFKHILDRGYYVTEALSLFLQDHSHAKWHSGHINGANRLREVQDAVEKAQQTGEPCIMNASLVLLAKRFTFCRPVSDRVKPGWYDDASYLEPEPLNCL